MLTRSVTAISDILESRRALLSFYRVTSDCIFLLDCQVNSFCKPWPAIQFSVLKLINSLPLFSLFFDMMRSWEYGAAEVVVSDWKESKSDWIIYASFQTLLLLPFCWKSEGSSTKLPLRFKTALAITTWWVGYSWPRARIKKWEEEGRNSPGNLD